MARAYWVERGAWSVERRSVRASNHRSTLHAPTLHAQPSALRVLPASPGTTRLPVATSRARTGLSHADRSGSCNASATVPAIGPSFQPEPPRWPRAAATWRAARSVAARLRAPPAFSPAHRIPSPGQARQPLRPAPAVVGADAAAGCGRGSDRATTPGSAPAPTAGIGARGFGPSGILRARTQFATTNPITTPEKRLV